jgi:U3 small nucleolar RNA-associated protein 10
MTKSILAQQLREIQQEDRVVRGVPAGKTYRPSFLFDEKEAADYDDEAIYAVAIEGFQTLLKEDSSLREYEEKFFSQASMAVDLSFMTRSERSGLTKEVGALLMRLSAHFMKNEAHRALEWMVRKWRVNEVFVDELIVSILPYHDTLPFVRMVQIVFFSDASRWSFLFERVKQSGSPLSRTLLAQRCTVDSTILTQVLRGFADIRFHMTRDPDYKFGSKYVSFVTYLLLETMSLIDRLDDQASIRFYQRIEVMIKSEHCPEGLVGAMIIFMSLCEKAPLSDSALEFFIRKIIKLSNPSIERNVILTVMQTVEAGFLEKIDPGMALSLCKMRPFAELMTEKSPVRFCKVLGESLSASDEPEAAIYLTSLSP